MGFNGQPDWSNISSYVQTAWGKGNYENLIEVVHIIHPNPDYNPRLMLVEVQEVRGLLLRDRRGQRLVAGQLHDDVGRATTAT
jgi:hypothetical protein